MAKMKDGQATIIEESKHRVCFMSWGWDWEAEGDEGAGRGGEERGMNIVTAAFKHKNHLRDNCRTLTNAGCLINGCDMRIIGSHNSSRTIGDHGSAGGGPEQPTCKKRKTKQKGTQQNEDKQTTAVCQPRMETGRQLVNHLST